MPSSVTHVVVNLLDNSAGRTGRAQYAARFNDVQAIYRCTPGERTTILKAAQVMGLSGAEFTRTILLQVASAVLLDGHETEATKQAVKKGPLRLRADVAPGAKR